MACNTKSAELCISGDLMVGSCSALKFWSTAQGAKGSQQACDHMTGICVDIGGALGTAARQIAQSQHYISCSKYRSDQALMCCDQAQIHFWVHPSTDNILQRSTA